MTKSKDRPKAKAKRAKTPQADKPETPKHTFKGFSKRGRHVIMPNPPGWGRRRRRTGRRSGGVLVLGANMKKRFI